MGEKTMYTCVCNWVPMLYSGGKKCVGEITIKKNKIKKKETQTKIDVGCKLENGVIEISVVFESG